MNKVYSLLLLPLLTFLIPTLSFSQVPKWEGVNHAYISGGSHASIRETATCPDGSILVTGRYNGDLEFIGGTAGFGNSKDGFLAKVNADGSFAWGRGQGKRANDTQCYSVDSDENNNVYAVGDFEYTAYIGEDQVVATGNSFDGFLVSYDKDGSKRWKRIFRGPNHVSASKVRTGDNLIVVSGYFDTEVNFGNGNKLINAGVSQFIVAYDTNGTFQWMKDVGWGESFTDMRIHSDGSIYYSFFPYFGDTVIIDGITSYPENTYNSVLVKTNNAGKAVWINQIGGSESMNLYNMQLDASGNIYYACNIKDSITYKGSTISSDTIEAGAVIKFDGNGNYVDIMTSEALFTSFGSNGNTFYAGGSFEGTINVGGQSATSSNGSNFFVMEIEDDLTVNWIHRGGEGGSSGVRVTGGSENYVGVVGYFGNDISVGDSSLSKEGVNDFFTANLLVKDFTSVQNIANSLKLTVYPNPFENHINLELPDAFVRGDFQLYDMSGKKYIQRSVSKDQIHMEVNDLPNGVYFYVLTDQEGNRWNGKLMKGE